MARGKKIPVQRRTAKSHDELPRHADWQNPRVVQILDAASRCFARDGLDKTTVQAIAREAGLTKSMIHYYFESKQVLILELQLFVHERYFRKVQRKLHALEPGSAERVQQALWEVYETVKDKQFLRLQLELLAEAGRDPAMHDRMRLALDRSREFIEEGTELVVEGTEYAQRVPKALSTLILSLLLGLQIQEYMSGDSETARQAYEFFVAMLSRGRARRTAGPDQATSP